MKTISQSKKTKKGTINYEICYDGIGARKTGVHTKTQFLNIMNKISKIPWKNKYMLKQQCAEFLKKKKCKSCKKYSAYLNYELRKDTKNKNKMQTKRNEKRSKYGENLIMKCLSCQTKTTKKCKLKDFIKFSGASIGPCKV